MEFVDPEIVEDSDAEVHQESKDGKSNQLLDRHTFRFVKLNILTCKCRKKESKIHKLEVPNYWMIVWNKLKLGLFDQHFFNNHFCSAHPKFNVEVVKSRLYYLP